MIVRRPRRFLLSALLLLAGCSAQAERERVPATAEGRGRVIDEFAWSYGGLALDETPKEMRRRFGEPWNTGSRSLPARKQDYYTSRLPLSPIVGRRIGSKIEWHNYPYAVFVFEDGRLVLFHVDEPGARTTRGVAIGDDLDRARDAYRDPDFKCFTESSEFHEDFPACTGYLGGERFIWFGGDPIENISMGVRQLASSPPG